MTGKEFLLYGAYGYTGKLIAKRAAAYGLSPVLAGRNPEKLKLIAAETGFRYKSFDLENSAELESALEETPMVLHAAGPFKDTAGQMVNACLKTGRHYIDINGDISYFQLIQQFDEEARKRNIMLMPGAGFDVVPTDCISLLLKNHLPDAGYLKIAFANTGSRLSHGTAMTMAGKLGESASKRVNGKIVESEMGENHFIVNFGKKEFIVMNISWGDVFTAWHTTGIPDIETFTAVPERMIRMLRFQSLFNWLLRTEMIRNLFRGRIKRAGEGPDETMLASGRSMVWAEAGNRSGKKIQATLEGPESYLLTAHSSLIITKKILEGNFKPGYQTPAGCYGENLVKEIPDVEISKINPI